MKKYLRTLLPNWFTMWLRARKLRCEIREFEKHYRPLVENAEAERERDEKERILSEWQFESRWPESTLAVLESRRLTRRALRWNIDSPAFEQDNQTGDWYIPDTRRRTLRREIIAARRETVHWWIQVLVMPLLALVGSTTALILALRGGK